MTKPKLIAPLQMFRGMTDLRGYPEQHQAMRAMAATHVLPGPWGRRPGARPTSARFTKTQLGCRSHPSRVTRRAARVPSLAILSLSQVKLFSSLFLPWHVAARCVHQGSASGPGVSVNRVMFCGSGEHLTRAELDGFTDATVRVFVAAYLTAPGD
ncbi:hypothetical protein GCM10010256_77850 [Streptomyces coeruleorubidus]|nr:hypothetical protein GCM10010256_77850 [Streptomyces coeruleorubidus]